MRERKKEKKRGSQLQLAVFSKEISPLFFFFSVFMFVMLKWMVFGENSLPETLSKTGEEENELKWECQEVEPTTAKANMTW